MRIGWLALGALAFGCAGDDEDPPPPPPAGPCAPEPGTICTIAGTGLRGANGDDLPALETHLFLPSGVTVDPDGRPVLADYNNMRIRVLDDDGILRTLAGSGLHAYASEDVPARDSALENPIDAAIGADGTLYVTELHGARVLRVDATGMISTYAGNPTSPGYIGYAGDGGPARQAELSESVGLAVADDGTLFIADTFNHCVRRVDPSGTIDTLAGAPEPGFVDGTGADARFYEPMGLAWEDGFVYVADRRNHAIRRIDAVTGAVVTIAGDGTSGFAGDGGPAADGRLAGPLGVAASTDGTVAIADSDNHVVRLIAPDGTLSTAIGRPGEFGFEGDGGPPEDALLSWPNDLAFGPDGELYVVDTLNDRLRVVLPP